MNDAECLCDCEPRARPDCIRHLLLEAILSFEHVLYADHAAVRIGGFDLEQCREGESFAFVVDVGTGLGGFGFLFWG